MPPSGTQVALESVAKRIEAWFQALADELSALKAKFRSGNDSAAEAFAKLHRGRSWTGVFTDRRTGRRFRAWGASCGSPNCRCDAIAEAIFDA